MYELRTSKRFPVALGERVQPGIRSIAKSDIIQAVAKDPINKEDFGRSSPVVPTHYHSLPLKSWTAFNVARRPSHKEKICTAWNGAVDTCVGYINGGRRTVRLAGFAEVEFGGVRNCDITELDGDSCFQAGAKWHVGRSSHGGLEGIKESVT
ncbi:hypothetical protein PLEOSDRAFT_1085765 [Pleurotus ostreatus PC15]|uniref:Uncharacterized protein n=1 Tax=Pleurotus ostreatus (strain PC15) TaxID=1137138 RepID=A0A067N9C2_PLEO1|nr:hypothetical protein PLEOSDRAFT_1085765 [Pleurotus ostreatus PC15]